MNRILVATLMLFLTLALSYGISFSGEKGRAVVMYPEKYRQWTHVKSMVIEKGHPLYENFGGIHHVYANDKALNAMKKGKPYPDNAVLVFDLLQADMVGNGIVEGPRKLLAVMRKDSSNFADTGGWGFEAFRGDTKQRIVKKPETDCFGCHQPRKDSDHVFSTYRK